MKLDRLAALVEKLPSNDRNFARSLVEKGKLYGLSENQEAWVDRLIARATGKEVEPKEEIEVKAILDLLTLARQHVKWPKIRLQTDSGDPVVFSLAGPKAKNPGSVNVTDGGKFREGQWYGRILTTGEWQLPYKGIADEVVEIVKRFAADPVAIASAYGQVTGSCCFCNLPLEDERSVLVGYGPVCAKHYGVPWGAKAVA